MKINQSLPKYSISFQQYSEFSNDYSLERVLDKENQIQNIQNSKIGFIDLSGLQNNQVVFQSQSASNILKIFPFKLAEILDKEQANFHQIIASLATQESEIDWVSIKKNFKLILNEWIKTNKPKILIVQFCLDLDNSELDIFRFSLQSVQKFFQFLRKQYKDYLTINLIIKSSQTIIQNQKTFNLINYFCHLGNIKIKQFIESIKIALKIQSQNTFFQNQQRQFNISLIQNNIYNQQQIPV